RAAGRPAGAARRRARPRGGADAHRPPAGRPGRDRAPARHGHPGNRVTAVSGGSGPGRSLSRITESPSPPGSLAVTGGIVVTQAGPLPADVVIEDGRIAALARPGAAPAAPGRLGATRGPVLPGGGDPPRPILAGVAA